MSDDPRSCGGGTGTCKAASLARDEPLVNRRPAGRGADRPWWLRWLGCLALLGLLAQAPASAAALAEPDASAVRKVVESQLEAFSADQPERAYAFASAGIRAQFGDAANFMAMVRGGYPMLVRPAGVTFFRAQTPDAAPRAPGAAREAIQVVQVRDRDGRLWRATYQLERRSGAGWRINGCVVVADSEKSTT